MHGRIAHTLTDQHQPGYDYTATMPDMREMARRMQLQAHTPLEVLQSPPDLGRKILRMKLQRFEQAPVANEATLARVRAASGSKPSWAVSSCASGPLQAQDMEPEADDYDEGDYTLNPDLDNPPYQSPAVSSAAAPSATAQPPLSPQALAPPSLSPSLPPVAAASSDGAAAGAGTRNCQAVVLLQQQERDALQAQLAQQAMLDKLQGEQLTHAEAVMLEQQFALRIKSAGMLAQASAQADEAEEKAKAEAEARAQAKAETDATREAETRLKAVMPYPFQLADPTKLRPAIDAAKKAGVPATSILAAEVKLREAIEKAVKVGTEAAKAKELAEAKAEAVARREAEGNLRAAMPNIFQPASSAQLQPAIAAAKQAGVAAATVTAAEAALREVEDQHRVAENAASGSDRVAQPSFPFVLPRWSEPFALFLAAERRGSRLGPKVTEPPIEPRPPKAKSPLPQLLLAAKLSDVDDRLSGAAGVVFGKAAAGASESTAAVSRATGSSHGTLEPGEDEDEDEYYDYASDAYSSDSLVAAPEATAAPELAKAQGTATKAVAALAASPAAGAALKISNLLSPRTPVSDDYDYEYYI